MTRSTSSKGTPATNFIENCFGVFKKARFLHSKVAPSAGSGSAPWAKRIGSKPPEEFHSRCL